MMTIRKCFALLWLGLAVSFSTTSANANNALGQTIQINTRFHAVIGNPVWLLILRNADTGVVLPYLYDVRNPDNFWIALSDGRNYTVTASTLKFGPFAVIHNFCHLEKGVLSGKSMIITLTGDLTPSPRTSKCRVLKYNGYAPFATPP